MATTINLSVGSGETKTLTFNTGQTFVMDNIEFVISGSGGDTNTTLSGICTIDGGIGVNRTATFPGFSLSSGQKILIVNEMSGAGNNMTLNVNNTGAKPLYLSGSAMTSSSDFHGGWYMGEYNGTYWNLIPFDNPNITFSDSGTDITNVPNITNGNVHLNFYGNGKIQSSQTITGSNGVSVTTDSTGNLVISGSGSGGGSTVAGKTVTLGTTGKAVLTVNGSDSGSVSLPSASSSVAGITKVGSSSEGAAAYNHAHGTITNGGYIVGVNTQQGGSIGNNQVAIASGDRLVIGDYSSRYSNNNFPLKLSSIVFGSSTTTYLRNDGTWGTPSGGGGGGSTVSAASSEMGVEGYRVGSITIDGNTTWYIVSPARPNVSYISSSGNFSCQGVVRPLWEVNNVGADEDENFTSFVDYGESNLPSRDDVIMNETFKRDCVYMPITFIYRYNTVTQKNESIPCIRIPLDIWENIFRDFYDGDLLNLC